MTSTVCTPGPSLTPSLWISATRAAPSGRMHLVVWTGSSRPAFSDNVDLDAAVVKNQTVSAAYATRADRRLSVLAHALNVVIRLLGSDDFPADAKQWAGEDLTAAARDGALSIAVDATLPLDRRRGTRRSRRVLVKIPD